MVARSASPGRMQTGRFRSFSVSKLDGVIVPLAPAGESADSAQMADLVALDFGRRRSRTPSVDVEGDGEVKVRTAGLDNSDDWRPARRREEERAAGRKSDGRWKWTCEDGFRDEVSCERKVGWRGARWDAGRTT